MGLAWPTTILILVLAFRSEIRSRLSAVREVKYPGGSITMEVNELAARVEQNQLTETVAIQSQVFQDPLPLGQGDSQLSIAQMRLSIERELFRLSWLTVGDHESVKGWGVTRHIDELRKADVLPAELSDNLRNFVDISNKILNGADVESEVRYRSTAIGASLAAQLHYRVQVRRLERDFEAHGLWHMHRHVSEDSKRYYWWSAVVATLPEFDYNYEIYREAAERFNQSRLIKDHPRDALYILNLDEFIQVLEFREKELLRLIETWHTHQSGDIWEKFRSANYWQWPEKWGELGWKAPIIREGLSLYAAEEDLLQTRNALNRYRPKRLTVKERNV